MKIFPLLLILLMFINIMNATAQPDISSADSLQTTGYRLQDEAAMQQLKSPAEVEVIVTASDYCDFLNEVAVADEDFLYDEKMSSDPLAACIMRIGTPGSYRYFVIAGREDFPVFYDSSFQQVCYRHWKENNFSNEAVISNDDLFFLGSNKIDFWVTLSDEMNQLSLITSGVRTDVNNFETWLSESKWHDVEFFVGVVMSWNLLSKLGPPCYRACRGKQNDDSFSYNGSMSYSDSNFRVIREEVNNPLEISRNPLSSPEISDSEEISPDSEERSLGSNNQKNPFIKPKKRDDESVEEESSSLTKSPVAVTPDNRTEFERDRDRLIDRGNNRTAALGDVELRKAFLVSSGRNEVTKNVSIPEDVIAAIAPRKQVKRDLFSSVSGEDEGALEEGIETPPPDSPTSDLYGTPQGSIKHSLSDPHLSSLQEKHPNHVFESFPVAILQDVLNENRKSSATPSDESKE